MKLSLKRILACVLGLVLYAFGVCMITRTKLGISPITSVPYTLTFIVPLSLGTCTFAFNSLLVVLQKIILGKDINLKTLLSQLVLTLVFSVFTDIAIKLIGWYEPTTYITRMLYLLAGCLIIAIGICLVVTSDVVLLPGDGCIKAISIKSKKEFGTAKLFFDSSCAILAIIISLIFTGRIVAIKEGTIVSILVIGNAVKFFTKKFKGRILETLDMVVNPI